jgi:hypothetical protein
MQPSVQKLLILLLLKSNSLTFIFLRQGFPKSGGAHLLRIGRGCVKFGNMEKFGNLCSNTFPILISISSIRSADVALRGRELSLEAALIERHILSAVLKQTYSSDCSRGGRECWHSLPFRRKSESEMRHSWRQWTCHSYHQVRGTGSFWTE